MYTLSPEETKMVIGMVEAATEATLKGSNAIVTNITAIIAREKFLEKSIYRITNHF